MTPQLVLAGRVATLRLDAPERRNAIGPDDVRALLDAFTRVEREPGLRVLVIEATGSVFCAGYDLRALAQELRGDGPSMAERAFPEAIDKLERLPIPTICVMRGAAYGGGVDLALACDFRLGTRRASILVPAARFGLSFYSGGLRRCVERLGLETAKRIFLLADTIDAPELMRLGYLCEIVADADMSARVEELIERLAANDEGAVAELKRSLAAIGRGDPDVEAIDEAFVKSFATPTTASRLGGKPERSEAH
jgi:enoyl-CoA hydratase/carnithine racemase